MGHLTVGGQEKQTQRKQTRTHPASKPKQPIQSTSSRELTITNLECQKGYIIRNPAKHRWRIGWSKNPLPVFFCCNLRRWTLQWQGTSAVLTPSVGAPRTQAGILHRPALLSPTFLGKGFPGGLQDNLACLQSRAEIEGLQPAACKVLRSARPSSTLVLTPGDTELPNTGRCTEGRGAANRARTLPGLHAAFPRISGWKTKHGFRTETKSQSLFASPCRRPPVPARLAAAGLPGSTRSSSRRRRLFHLPAGAHFGSSRETPSVLFRLRERPGGGDPAATRQHSQPNGVPPPPPASPPASPCPGSPPASRAPAAEEEGGAGRAQHLPAPGRGEERKEGQPRRLLTLRLAGAGPLLCGGAARSSPAPSSSPSHPGRRLLLLLFPPPPRAAPRGAQRSRRQRSPRGGQPRQRSGEPLP